MARRVEPAFGMDGRGRVAGASLGPRRSTRRARRRAGAGAYASSARAAEGCAAPPGGGRGFHNGTLVSYSSKLRSVDMRSSSSSGIGHDMVESLRASYQNPCWAARRRVRSRALRQLVTGEVVTT